ncbi:hypothetical protein PtA15_2A30 [Puccinia triticina]|uniref:DUF4042 domain-containing protein n=1 Tax=Puccinia triticina TaxID=208348 RepID=A0ABY7C991_9BASI|nr:uncharacterized protein PtA15_2A30 [Puccinia triticina]WAQ81719.1 hypothetical protein PtA15_2A30 [Puccinia triticina]WAR52607.1 hypothetical protein PtB15_2B31 [Puccinia triticina]
MPSDDCDLSGIHSILNDVLVRDSQARLKALRELKNLLARPCNQDDFPDSTRVNLANSILTFPVTAKLASQVLLQIISNSSPIILSQQSQSIVQPVLSSLSSATQHLHSIPSKDQLVKIIYLIRILTTMIAKAGSCALINLTDQIDCIQRCYQPITPNQLSHPPERIVLGSQTHQRNLTSRAPRIHPQSSDSETNSEGEGTRIPNTDVQAVQSRLDALNYLRTIAQSDPKALYPFWPQLLPAHEYRTQQPYTLLNVVERDCQLMVRLRACSVMKMMLDGAGAYMAIAEENNLRVSYISLSAKIASITIELHRRLGCLLHAPVVAPALTKELLEVCEALNVVSAYHRISTPILGPFLKPIIGLLTSGDSEINIQSRKTLTTILKHLASMSKSSALDHKLLIDEITTIGCECLLSELNKTSVLLWGDLLRTSLQFVNWNENLIEKVLKLHSLFEEIPDDEEELRSKLFLIASLIVFFPGMRFDDTYIKWVRARLVEVGLDSLDFVVNGKSKRNLTHIFNTIVWDLQAVWDDIRAIRLLGIIVSKRCISQPLELVTKVTFYLLCYFQNIPTENNPDENDVSTHTWTLANCLDTINEYLNGQASNPPFDLSFWMGILHVTRRLLSRGGSSNTLKTNSVRIIGVAVCQLPIKKPLPVELEDAVNKALEKAFEFLGATLPKVQWNAASSLRQILIALSDGPVEPDGQASDIKSRICERLSDTLESSSSFKVRIQVCLALQVVQHDLSAQILRSIAKTKQKLDDEFGKKQIPNKEADHAERLQLEIGKLLVDITSETPG